MKFTGRNLALDAANQAQQEINDKVATLPHGATHVSIDGSSECVLTLRGAGHVALGGVKQDLLDLISHSPVRWL